MLINVNIWIINEKFILLYFNFYVFVIVQIWRLLIIYIYIILSTYYL